MSEHYTNPDEYKEYLEWKESQDKPALKPGDIVRVPRSSGEIEENWSIKFVYPREKDGVMMCAVTKGNLRKDLPLSDLEKYN